MRAIFTHPDFTRVGYCKSILDSEEILCWIRNQNVESALEAPSILCRPTLCVMNDEDYDRAMEILRPFYKPQETDATDWVCNTCGEKVPANFDFCWKCEKEKITLI
ncbi:MAG: DUF2007 domain-containing protein [Chthoniobacterales bacterium]